MSIYRQSETKSSMLEMSVTVREDDDGDALDEETLADTTPPPDEHEIPKKSKKSISVKIGGVGFDERVKENIQESQRSKLRGSGEFYLTRGDSKSLPEHNVSLRRKLSQSAAAVVQKKRVPSSFRVTLLLIPFALIIFGIRFRHDQIVSDDDHGTAYSYSSSSKYSYGGSSGDDDHADDHVATVFVLASGIDTKETSLVFVVIISATIVLDFLIESLNEACEHAGDVYVRLARALYQELMSLGVIAFVIFFVNAEGFFWNKQHLFHEIEYTHIVIFYLGLGLIVQGLALAIINKDVKTVWRISSESTLEEMAEQLATTKRGFLGEWRVKHGWGAVNQYLDIHLVRIAFLDIMNLPNNFAYNEYVNFSLDDLTLKIANNNLVSWSFLIAVVTAAGRLHPDGVFMGTDEDGFRNFMICAVALVAFNIALLVVITVKEAQLLAKLGSTGNLEEEYDLIQAKWPVDEGWQDIHALLRDMEQQIEQKNEDDHNRASLSVSFSKGSALGKTVTKTLSKIKKGGPPTTTTTTPANAGRRRQVLKTDSSVNLKVMRLSAVGRRIKQLGARIKSADKLQALGIDARSYDKFQKMFNVSLRVANLMQAFYISLTFAHWGWYAPSTPLAFVELLPIFAIYLFLTPRIVRRYAIILSLGKANQRALSKTIVYMEHNEESLHQVAELIINSKSETETIDDVFQAWDTNKDGVISFKELTEAMATHNMHLQKERLQAMWRKIDIDSGGSISMSEFRKALSPYVRLVEMENSANAEMLKERFVGDPDSAQSSRNSESTERNLSSRSTFHGSLPRISGTPI